MRAIKPKSGKSGCVFEIVETLILTGLIFLGIQTFVAQPFMVQQQSMERTLEPQQYVLVDKLTPRLGPYRRGDIVVFNPPAGWDGESGTPLIKRVIAVAGERVEIEDGTVRVNGREIDEPYVYDRQPTEASSGVNTWLVPAGELFVLGDHRSSSADSRVFGPVSINSVIGRAWLRYWPPSTFGVLLTPASSAGQQGPPG